MKKLLFIIFMICYTTCFSQDLVNTAKSYLYVREIKPNRSLEIDMFNKNVGATLGSPWCASYMSFIFDSLNYFNPHSAWSPNFTKNGEIIYKKNYKNNKKILPGDVVTFYYSNLGRVGHVGMVVRVEDNIIYTIEGNTNGSGSRDGDGVYLKKRNLDKIYMIIRYNKKADQN